MKPLTAHTIVIGDCIPDIVQMSLLHNHKLFKNSNIEYLIHKLDRDTNYHTAGIQAEYFKIALLGYFEQTIVLDWDVYLSKVPDIPVNSIAFGYWTNASILSHDMFLTFNTHSKITEFFRLFNEINISHKNGFTKKVSVFLSEFGHIVKIPSEQYCHFNTNLGISALMFSDLNHNQQLELDKICYKKLKSWGDYYGIDIDSPKSRSDQSDIPTIFRICS